MSKSLLSRRQFSAGCAAVGLSFSASKAIPAEAPAPRPPRTVTFPDGTVVPALGQGSWHLGQGRHQVRVEEEALRIGIDLGMTVIDSSENYGDGRSEEVIGRVIAGQREKVFVVTKVEPHNVSGGAMARACNGSLKRLDTDYIDLYLLHGPVATNRFGDVVEKFEELRTAGKIRRWGVSNFNLAQMEALFAVPDGNKCATNQVLYNLRQPYIEREMLPWCTARKMPVMAYSPLGSEGLIVRDSRLAEPAAKMGVSPAAAALAWVMRSGNVLAIPEALTPDHVKENAAALFLR